MTGTGAGGGSSHPKARSGRVLDQVDKRIVQLLMQDGRLRNHVIASQVSVAESTSHARIQSLVETGVIRGFHADVDPAAIGRPLQALIFVRLHPGARPELTNQARRLAGCAAVQEVFFVGGHHDLIVYVAVANSEELRDFVVDELSSHREISATETSVVLERLRGDLAVT